MVARGEMQAVAQGRLAQLADDVAVRAHLDRVPVRELAAVHLEAVVVFGDGEIVARAGRFEQVEPFVRVEPLGREHRDEVLVAELILRAVGLAVMLVFGVSLDVHVA